MGQDLRIGQAAVLCALFALLLAAPVLAQNSAEGKAPPQRPPTVAERDRQQQSSKPADSADKAAEAQPQDAAADAPAEPDKQDEAGATPEREAGAAETSGPARPGPNAAAAGAERSPGVVPGAPEATVPPRPQGPPAGSGATSQVTPETAGSSAASQPGNGGSGQVLPPITPPNAAESRPAGGTSTNFAEGWDTTADPPEPDYRLPAPSEIAGPSANYAAPEISLLVPGIDPVPDLPGEDMFQRPGREYVERRPLPPLDETETEEERLSRNVEESLRQIDLTLEERPAPGTQLQTSSGTVVFRAADAFQYDRRQRVMTFTGGAEILFNGMLVAADFIEVNDGAATAYAKDYVMLAQADEVLYADEAFINYDTQQLELFWVEGNTGGTRLSNGVVYFEADRAWGTFDHLIMERVKVTTCDPYCGQVREVHLSAKKAVYKRDRSIVLHDVHPHVRSHKVGWIPVLAFPLARQRQPFEQDESEIQQNYGWNNSDGWFAKFAYTYYTHYVEEVQAELKGVAKVEIVQNLGAGAGVRQDFYIPALGITTVEFFYQRDWPEPVATGVLGRKQTNGNQNYNFKLEQELNLSRALKGSLYIERVNLFQPATQFNLNGSRINTWNNRFQMDYAKGDTRADLTATQSISTTGGFLRSDSTTEPENETTGITANFNLTQQVSDELKFTLRQSYTANKEGGAASGIPANQEGTFETQLEYTGRRDTPLDGYRAQLTYKEQGIDYDQDKNTRDNNFQISKELPKLRIDMPRDLFNDGAYFTQFDMSFANLVSGRRRNPSSSFAVNLHAGGSDLWQFSRASSLQSRTDFNQYLYDDGNAQYSVSQSSTYRYDPRKTWNFSLNHNLMFRQGVREPPVSGDRKTYNQNVSGAFMLTNRRSWRWQLQSGYNLGLSRWNAITSNLSWDPNRSARLIYNTSYDLERSMWGLSTIQSSWLSPYVDDRGVYNWVLNAAVDLDTNYWDEWKMSQLRLTYFRRYERGWSAEVTGGYRTGGGSDYPPDFSDWHATEDFLRNVIKTVTVRKVNCCTTLEGSWSASRNEFQLKMYLNALPQYPGSTNVNRFERRNPDNNAVMDGYLYKPQFLFPTDALRNDILTDLFGIEARF